MANNMVNSLFFLAALLFYATDAFAPNSRTLSFLQSSSLGAASTSTAISASADEVQASVSQLKRVLEREYISFFDPMRTEYYAKDVTFDDPMTSLSGVASYQKNVDMLAGRTLMGKVLFDDAGIILHSVTGGEVLSDSNNNNINIQDITTCWTLKVTAKVIPWKPTAIFSGISVYKVKPTNKNAEGVIITGQTDYWDSINITPDGKGMYGKVEKNIAVSDFLRQLKPSGFKAQTAAPELPYSLLRRGDGYEIRRYPSYTAVEIPYGRRDEGFGTLGSFTNGMKPLGPAILSVPDDQEANEKRMMWPLTYALPGSDTAPPPSAAIEKADEQGQWRKCEILTFPETVVAVRKFKDASMGPVVRGADKQLREFMVRDGLVVGTETDTEVRFAQYDAIFSMGERRGEVWINLQGGGANPW